MPWVAAGFLAAIAFVVVLALPLGQHHPAPRMAAMLLLFWVVANLTDPFIDPWLDAAGFYAVLMTWFVRPSRWLIALGTAFFLQMLVSLGLQEAPWHRMLALNVLLAAEILAVLFGTVDGLVSLLRRRSRGRAAGHSGLHSGVPSIRCRPPKGTT